MPGPQFEDVQRELGREMTAAKTEKRSGEIVLRVGLNEGAIVRANIQRDTPIKARIPGFEGRAEHDGA